MEPTSASHEQLPPEALAEALAKLEHDLAEGQARIQARRAWHHTLLGELKSARATTSDLSWELEDLEQRLSDLKAQREGPGDPLRDRELASVSRHRAVLEEQVLAQMLMVDDLATRVAGAGQALADEERSWAVQQALLRSERDRIRGRLATPTPRE